MQISYLHQKLTVRLSSRQKLPTGAKLIHKGDTTIMYVSQTLSTLTIIYYHISNLDRYYACLLEIINIDTDITILQ